MLNAVKIRFITGFILITFLVTICPLSAIAQRFQLSGGKQKEAISFKLVKNLIIIPLIINGKGPYNFVLDTGIGFFLVTDPALLDTLHIQYLRSIKISGFGTGED